MCCICKLFILLLQTYCLAEITNYNNIKIEDPTNVEHYIYRSWYYDKPSHNRSWYYDKPSHNRSWYYEEPTYNRSWYYDKPTCNRSHYYDKSTYNRTWFYKKPRYNRTRYYDKSTYNRTWYYDKPSYNRTRYYDKTTYNRTWFYDSRRQITSKPWTLEHTMFMPLLNYENRAYPVTYLNYPWIASVVHSRTGVEPYMCTASLIEKGIFITAARCLANLKILQTRVIYKNTGLHVRVFVMPSPPTKQMFDDVGLIVVSTANFKGTWNPVKLFTGKRTDDKFEWFFKLHIQKKSDHKVVGYAYQKNVDDLLPSNTPARLTELPVTVGIVMCKQIYANIKINGFYVPCYCGCKYQEFLKRDIKCSRYHGTLGGAVYNFVTKELLGVATWGKSVAFSEELPVGFAVPNSDNFYKDLACAKKINNDKHPNPPKGHFQKLCP